MRIRDVAHGALRLGGAVVRAAWGTERTYLGRRLRTHRPLNRCTGCGHEWFPRGKDVSDKCPRCRSEHVYILDY
jgi:hypothetical protein